MTTTVSRKGTVLNGDTSDTACMHSNAFGGLWRHPDFVKLWSAHTISWFGSEVSQLAIPLTAALVLNASAFEMGLLGLSSSRRSCC
jgi:hypothetical protein